MKMGSLIANSALALGLGVTMGATAWAELEEQNSKVVYESYEAMAGHVYKGLQSLGGKVEVDGDTKTTQAVLAAGGESFLASCETGDFISHAGEKTSCSIEKLAPEVQASIEGIPSFDLMAFFAALEVKLPEPAPQPCHARVCPH